MIVVVTPVLEGFWLSDGAEGSTKAGAIQH